MPTETKKTSVQETAAADAAPDRKLNGLGMAFVVVMAVFVGWILVITITGVAQSWQSLDIYFGLMFGASMTMFLVPITHKPEDADESFLCKKSWCWWFEQAYFLVLVMFTIFVATSLYMVRIVGTGSTDAATAAFTAAFIAAFVMLIVQSLHEVAYIITVIFFVCIMAFEALPIPKGGTLAAVATISIFAVILIAMYLRHILKVAIAGEISLHVLDGMAIMYSALFLFEGYMRWLDMDLISRSWILLYIGSIAICRALWKSYVKGKHKHISEALFYTPVPKAVDVFPKEETATETTHLLQMQQGGERERLPTISEEVEGERETLTALTGYPACFLVAEE